MGLNASTCARRLAVPTSASVIARSGRSALARGGRLGPNLKAAAWGVISDGSIRPQEVMTGHNDRLKVMTRVRRNS